MTTLLCVKNLKIMSAPVESTELSWLPFSVRTLKWRRARK